MGEETPAELSGPVPPSTQCPLLRCIAVTYSLPGLEPCLWWVLALSVKMSHWISLLDCITVVEFTSMKVASVCVCVCVYLFPRLNLSKMDIF